MRRGGPGQCRASQRGGAFGTQGAHAGEGTRVLTGRTRTRERVREYSQEERARVGAERGAVDERDEQPRLRRAGVRVCERVRVCARLLVGARLCACVWVRAPTWVGPSPGAMRAGERLGVRRRESSSASKEQLRQRMAL
jgi:hypothetical protein